MDISKCTKAIRTSKIGTNLASLRYTTPYQVTSRFRDLAWFVVHTGFANFRLNSEPLPDEYVFTSLENAWQLFEQGYDIWFILGMNHFVINRVDAVKCMMMYYDDMLNSSLDTCFRPDDVTISVDSLIDAIVTRNPDISACYVHRAIFVVMPTFSISRMTISYRMSKRP